MPEHGSTPSSPTSPTKARRDKRRSRSSRQSSKDFYDASEGDAPTVAPPTAFVPGRRVSAAADKPPLVESTAPVKKEDTIQEKKVDETAPEVDEFGLPVRKTKRTTEDRLTSDDEEHVEVRESEVKQRGSVEDAKESTEVHKSKDEEDEPKTPTRTTSPPPYEAVSPVSVNDSKRSRAGTTGTTGGAPGGGVSEWSHQALAPTKTEEKEEEEEQWQAMSAYDQYDVFDDDGRLVAKGAKESDDEDVYEGLGGAGKGYTRVQIDDDAKSATSMDENTSYLFQGKERGTTVVEEDDEQRDPLQQMAATKTMLTEGQRIAYVGVTRLAIVEILETLERVPSKKATKKELASATESMKKWGQMMMVRLYSHMEIDSSEQVMIEQLAEHGVKPPDLTPALKANSRVQNPMAGMDSTKQEEDGNTNRSSRSASVSSTEKKMLDAPPAYSESEEPHEVVNPDALPTTQSIDIDIRWTVLCDLFLVLVSDSVYDARSRVLLEAVGSALDVKWVDICRFEKRVTDALEMQEAAARETWDEAEHMETRRKKALKRRYVMMGLATAGGTLVIGLSAGLLAPLIGAGLAAGFTTIGVAGTSGFLAGAGGTAIITTGAAISGGTIGVRASSRRWGVVKTFEYRPLHNNKRVNLIVTISGWMNGKVDDVRLPFSTVDPIMGDMYSVLWEPEVLQSVGDTIRILATEALTQGLQQVLASTILTALMASLTLPIVLTKLSYLLDNPWNVSQDRADAAGLILADSLLDRNLGARPITLVGFSLGARVIFSALKELANKEAYGLIQNVYLFGSPLLAKKDDYLRARLVISGRFVNGYATNDWILGYLFRATSGGISRLAGLAAVDDVPGLENIDVTDLVNGHMAYRTAIPKLLRRVGWEVESDEFSEIEDPDPDNHEGRHRELIREIEDARKEAEKPEKGRFAFFKRKKAPDKKKWETYDESSTKEADPKGDSSADRRSSKTLFDIDAIRAELESEQMQVREIESTLPPMRLDLNQHTRDRSQTDAIPQNTFSPTPLHTSKSMGDAPSLAVPPTYDSQSASLLTSGRATPRLDDDDEQFHTPPANANVSMSFDHPKTRSDEQPLPSPLPSAALPSAVLAWRSTTPVSEATPARPEIKSANSMPAAVPTQHEPIRLDHNAWADEEEEWGKEREMVMSFE